jgi:hypothetical protein
MKRIGKFKLLVGVFSAAFLLGQNSSNFDKSCTPQNDALTAARRNHKLLFETDEARMLEVSVPPAVREPLHAHRYTSVLYCVSAAHMKEYSPGLAALDRGYKDDGAVIFLPIGPPIRWKIWRRTSP